jgi:hypothetical protein
VRNPVNAFDKFLYVNTNAIEATGTDRMLFLSNGIKLITTAPIWNGSGGHEFVIALKNNAKHKNAF